MAYTPKTWVNDSHPAIDAAAMQTIEDGIRDLEIEIDEFAHGSTHDNIVYVAKNGSDATGDGSFCKPFLTIEHANNHAIANIPAWPGRTVIKVAPGIYREQITAAHYRVWIVGFIDPTEKGLQVQLTNTGADEAHYPLAVPYSINLVGITINTTDADEEPIEGIYGKIMPGSTFSYCHFNNGYFIEEPINPQLIYMYMYKCQFYGDSYGFRLEGTVAEGHFLNFDKCSIDNVKTAVFSSTGGSNTIKLDNSYINQPLEISGDWSTLMMGSEMTDVSSIDFDTDGYVDLFASILTGNIHFTTDTAQTKKMVNCIFKFTPAGIGDITADVPVEFIEYSGNHQMNGIDGEIITVSKIKNVGGGQNMYRNIHEALRGSLLTDTIINLEGDIEITTPLILNSGIDVQIDGNKKWKMNVLSTPVMCGLDNDEHLAFVNMKQITGGAGIHVQGTNSSLSIISCGSHVYPNSLNIIMQNGTDASSFVYIDQSTIIGHNDATISIYDADPELIIDDSFIKGAAGEPAIRWYIDADGKFKCKYTTLVHGDGLSNSPLDYNPSSGRVDIAMYNSSMNAAFSAADFSNTIGNASVTIDPEIDY